MTKKYYEVQALEQDGRYADGSRVVIDTCDHRHRTEAAAEKCAQKLMTDGCAPGEWRPKWRRSRVQVIEY